LGDLVLAAEQPLGAGRVFVLGDTSPLRNEMLVNSYPFVGRLLAYLAQRSSSPQALWRQLLALAAIVAMVALLAARPAAWQLMLTPSVMAVALTCSTAAAYWSGRVLPEGRPDSASHIAYIDASHLEAFSGDSSDLSAPFGVAGLARTLMRQGYLPLLAPDLTPERLGRCGLLIAIAPAAEFSLAERAAVQKFVHDGGTFVCMVGAEEARAVAPLLADFHFKVSPSPVPPEENSREPEPLGAKYGRMDQGNRRFRYYAAWPVECDSPGAMKWSVWSDGKNERPIIVSRSEQKGSVVVIGDTRFASNENLESAADASPDRILFWRWLLSRVVPGQKAWNPPPGGGDLESREDSPADEEDGGDSEDGDNGNAGEE
jgi:hypothetical protein